MQRRLTIAVEEAAAMLGISRTSAYQCAARGEIPTRRVSRRVLVLYVPLMAMLGETQSAEPLDGASIGPV